MSTPQNKSWLDKIQQDSWQLELLVSGFVIFLLIGSWGPIMDLEYTLSLFADVDTSYFLLVIFYYLLRTAYQAMLFFLLVHVVLRGLWIAAIGLRYVSGDIDYDALKYQDKFNQHLRRRIGSFDNYIEQLERYCSVIFSIAFLILFCFISLTSYFVVVTLVQVAELKLTNAEWNGRGISMSSSWSGRVLFLFGIIYLVDFVSLGYFKRSRFTAKPYYYLYRLMGWITLARFYRPLYYNLIDQRFGRRLARLLPVFIMLSLAAVSFQVVKYAYFPFYTKDGKIWVDHQNYDDERQQSLTGQNWRVTLGSKYSENNYVEVFRPYRPLFDNEVIEKKFPDLEVSQYPGIKFSGAFTLGEQRNRKANYDSLLIAATSMHRLYLNDSLVTDVKPRFHFNEKRQLPGLLYMLPVHDLTQGEHYVRVSHQEVRADTLRWTGNVNIYFYK